MMGEIRTRSGKTGRDSARLCGVRTAGRRIPHRAGADRGESLVETIVSLMIACMGLMILPGAIVAAANVNARAENASIFPAEETSGASATVTISITEMGAAADSISRTFPLKTYEDEAGKYQFRYYRMQEE